MVSPAWNAKRIFNFLKAYQYGNTVFPCEINGQIFNLMEAISYDSNTGCKLKLTHDKITFPCSKGCLTASIQTKTPHL